MSGCKREPISTGNCCEQNRSFGQGECRANASSPTAAKSQVREPRPMRRVFRIKSLRHESAGVLPLLGVSMQQPRCDDDNRSLGNLAAA